MLTLRERFADFARPQTRPPLLGEDLVLDTERIDALQSFRLTHEQLRLFENPLAVRRTHFLEDLADSHVALRADVSLCWEGFGDAVELLFRFAEAFERALPVEQVSNTAEALSIGDVGVAWSWLDLDEPDVLAFVRRNVLVALQGHDISGQIVMVARAIDRAIQDLKTTDAYEDDPDGVFAEVRRSGGEAPEVGVGARLPLGTPARGDDEVLFVTEHGSVNRDPAAPAGWYYRAGLEPGAHEIVAYRVGRGVLPRRERLTVQVTGRGG